MSHHRLSTPPGIIVPPWRYYMTLVEQASVPGDPPGVVPPWRYHMTLVEQASVPGDVQPRYCSTMALPYDVGGTRLGSRRPQHIGSVTLLHYEASVSGRAACGNGRSSISPDTCKSQAWCETKKASVTYTPWSLEKNI